MERRPGEKSSIKLRPVQELYNPASRLTIRPKTSGLYKHQSHVVYAEAYGVGLTMDVFQPLDKANGYGIIDVVSNGWFSDRHQLIQHIGLGVYDVLCNQGYSVFALSPGSIQVFNGMQMVRNVQAGIQYILLHMEQFGINKKKLGIMGISAGGHLAMNALLHEPKFISSSPAERKPYYKYIPITALFCSPTDLLSFYSLPSLSFDIKEILKRLARRKTFLEEELNLN
ncbi:MAG: alpha/beta hydrolase family protein, partial [Candidatus Hydrogenedens sp.]